MNRLAACAVVGICLSSFACKSANVPAPPPPMPAFPAGCDERHGVVVPITVNKTAGVAAVDDCIVLDKGAVVDWGGNSEVTTLLVGWKAKSTVCSEPPAAPPACTKKNCQFTSPNPTGTMLTFCYGMTIIDQNGKIVPGKDPRLIIRP